MKRWPAHLFFEHAAQAGLERSSAAAALAAAARTQDFGLPALLTLRHLSEESGCPYGVLRRVVERRMNIDGSLARNPADLSPFRYAYRVFYIRKRSGGRRRIFVPNHGLMLAQKWLATNVFGKMAVHHCAYAYRQDINIVDWAQQHCSSLWLIKFDIEEFFESIHEQRVYWSARRGGYAPLVSLELARICTVPASLTFASSSALREELDRRYTAIPAYVVPETGFVPQGAPTSSAISNLVCIGMDEQLASIAESAGLVYTRYADDITFSSADRRLAKSTISNVRMQVCRTLHAFGFNENRRKFHVAGPGDRRIVGGLLVDGPAPRLSRTTRARIRRQIFFLRTHGVHSHALTRGFRSISGMRDHISGLLAHAKQVDEQFWSEVSAAASMIDWPPS